MNGYTQVMHHNDDDPPEIQIVMTPRARAALNELQSLIVAHFPEATFEIQKGYEPAGIYLVATVDVEDAHDVVEVFGERLVDFQVDDRIPVYVSVQRPFERTWTTLQEQKARRPEVESLPTR